MKAVIYNSASIDVKTHNIPIRNEKSYLWTNGQRNILNDDSFTHLREIISDTKRFKKKHEEFLRSMLKLEAPFKKEVEEGNSKIENLKKEITNTKDKLIILKENIKEEIQRLTARGYEIPDELINPKTKESNQTIPDDNPTSQNTKNILKKAKKWIAVFAFIVVLESFFGLAQFEFLSTYKSNTAILLRIAASALIVITLHIAEYQYKELNKKIFKTYIVFAIIMLFSMLFGSLLLNYYFPDSITSSEIAMNWNLSDSESNINTKPTLIGFLNQFDFIPAIISILVFLLMFLLSKEDKQEIQPSDPIEKDDLSLAQNEESIIFNHLKYLQSENSDREDQLASLNAQYYHSKHYVSIILLKVKQSLEKSKAEIEEYNKLIDSNKNRIDNLLCKIEAQLKIYEVDFMDIFRGSTYTTIVTPEWPNLKDIKQYYTL